MFKKILIGILLIVLGFAIGWFINAKISEAGFEDYRLVKSLAQAGYNGNILMLLKDQKCDRLKDVLLLDIGYSLDDAQLLVRKGTKLKGSLPNIINCLHRTRLQTARLGRSKLAEKITNILELCLEYSREDKNFKKNNLSNLRAYAPGFNGEQQELWSRFINLAKYYEDYDIIKAMFSLKDKTDAALSTQYALDMFELYKKNPDFFVKSLNRYYEGDFKKFLPIWINEVGDIACEQVIQYTDEISNKELARKFIEAAKKIELEMQERIERPNNSLNPDAR